MQTEFDAFVEHVEEAAGLFLAGRGLTTHMTAILLRIFKCYRFDEDEFLERLAEAIEETGYSEYEPERGFVAFLHEEERRLHRPKEASR
jgi:hypothetical protein